MLVTPCPNCGKPTPARLASPDALRCSACGYAGPPPPTARAAIVAARSHLENRDVRARQISSLVRRTSLGWRTALLIGTFVLSSLPTLGFVAIVMAHLVRPEQRQLDYATTWSAFFSLFIGWSVGAVLLAKHRRDQAAIRRAIAAVPALRAGDPAACRVCGADLPAGGAIVRCAFCGTDNYADDKTIRRLDAREANDVAAFEEDLRVETASTAERMASASRSLLVAALVMPVGVLLVVSVALAPLAARVESTLDESTKYTSAATRDGECIGVPVHPSDGDTSYTLDLGTARYEPPSSLGERYPLSWNATAIVGKPVHVDADNDHHEVRATVVKVYGSPIGNLALLHTEDGKDLRVDIRGICLSEPAAGIYGETTGGGRPPAASAPPGSGDRVVDVDGTVFAAKGGTVVRTARGGAPVVIFQMAQVFDGDHPNERITDLTLVGDLLSFVYDTGHTYEGAHPLAMRLPKRGGVAHVIDDMLGAKR